MTKAPEKWCIRACVLAQVTLLAATAFAADTQMRSIGNGLETKVRGVIQARDGDKVRVREADDSVVTVQLEDTTKVMLKHGLFNMSRTGMETTSLVPGLRIEAEGKGNDKGDLVAAKITFDPNDLRAARSVDTRVLPLESRTGHLENRAGQLEGRAGQLETRSTDLEGKTNQLDEKQKQTDETVAKVNDSATKANSGVDNLGHRVTDLDDYETKGSTTIYFAVKSAKLTPEACKELDELIDKTKSEKGYMIEVAGFADSTGNAEKNVELSEKRAAAVVQYLQMKDVPLRRILAPAGLGTSHSVAENSTPEGRKQNRRVEVKVLVNRGITTG
jgi:outer membrane protein OmpA-like peptidoglycan-associated protein